MTKRAIGLWSITIKDLILSLDEAGVTLPDWMDFEEHPNLELKVRVDRHGITFMGVVDEYIKPGQIVMFPNLVHQEEETKP